MLLRKIALVLLLSLSVFAAQAANVPGVRAELVKILNELGQPLITSPEEGKAWHLRLEGEVMGKQGQIELGWDAHAHHFLQVKVDDLPPVTAGFGDTESWLYLPEKKKLFLATHSSPNQDTLLTHAKAWDALTAQVPAFLAAAMFIPIPEDVTLEKKEDGTIVLKDQRDLNLEVTRKTDPTTIEIISRSEKFPGHLKATCWEQVPTEECKHLLAKPAETTVEPVEIEHLRGMLVTLTDFSAEAILQKVNPGTVPDPLANVPKVDGTAVVKLKGTPEEIGTQHGTLLKEAVHFNVHRTLHGVGLFSTVQSGKWFPAELNKTWAIQEKYIPERFIREIDALSVAAGIPKEWGRSINLFPEHFHCSGLALRGKATVDGKLFHGRVLDYMTGIGLQHTAVLIVYQPNEHNAWASVSYAGLCGTVTAMNIKGLAMGEMGGHGEGYLEGIPMSLMMREVIERFETTEAGLSWMQSVPRTCEYFYVLSDAQTKSMAGIASLAKKLAEERGITDLKIIRPGEFDDRLPHPVEDTVLMSADKRYEKLSERVKEGFGKLDMQGAWDLMKGGVAMKSNLHTALFAPETLDIWTSQAGYDGKPAYTQHVSKMNLKTLISEEPTTQTSDSGTGPKTE